jgi:hypothetical protein
MPTPCFRSLRIAFKRFAVSRRERCETIGRQGWMKAAGDFFAGRVSYAHATAWRPILAELNRTSRGGSAHSVSEIGHRIGKGRQMGLRPGLRMAVGGINSSLRGFWIGVMQPD